jgi:hypothetical protein
MSKEDRAAYFELAAAGAFEA